MILATVQRNTRVFERWLGAGCVFGVVVGLWLVAIALAPDALHFEVMVRGLFWPRGEQAGSATAVARQATAVSGALTLGWSVTVFALRDAIASGPPSIARAIVRGFMAWFVVDSFASVAVGGTWNVVGNVSFFVAVAVPAFALERVRRAVGSERLV